MKARALFATVLAAAACGGHAPSVTVPAPPPSGSAATPAPVPATAEKPMPEKVLTQTAQPQVLAFPDEAFRAKQPPAGPPHAFQLPKMQTFTLKNGISVYLVEQHTLPIVSMDLNFDGGTITDPKGKEGLASACMTMLTEGTAKLDKIAYSEALADIASNIGAYAGEDTQGVWLSTLTKHLDDTFALFADTLRTPGLRQADFDRVIKRRIEGVKQERGNPSAVPWRVADSILFGPVHPLGAIVTEQSLGAITLADCKHELTTWLQPRHARLFVVGDMTEQQVRETVGKSPLGAWVGTPPPEPRIPEPKTRTGRIFFVDVPGAAQSTVVAMHFGPRRTAPDYLANTIMASVLGGSFTSRLNMNLREDKGYAYGARGGFHYTPKQFGELTASASVQTDATYPSLLEIAHELTDLHTGKRPVTAEELEREKTNAILALPGEFATAQQALGRYRGLVYYGLPLDYYNTYVAKVGKVTLAQVNASAKQHLRPDRTVYLVVGDGASKVRGTEQTLRDALVALAKRGDVGPGAFVELDADGKPAR